MSESSSNGDDERVPTLPQGWVTSRIGNTLTIVRGISFPKESKRSTFTEGYIACLRTANVQKEVEWDDLWFIPLQYLKNESKKITINDILISTANSSNLVGKVSLVKFMPYPSTLGAFISLLRTPSDLNSKFIFYQIASSEIQENLRFGASTTTNISNISNRIIDDITLKIPPLQEQHRIVTKIEELFTQLDAGVASLKKVQAELKRYRQAVLKAAFEGRLTQEWREKYKGEIEPTDVLRDKIVESQQKWIKGKSKNIDNVDPEQFAKIPEEWIWTRIHNIAPFIQYGSSEKADDDTTGIPIIRMGNLQDGKIDFSNLKYISKKSPEVAKCLLYRGDVLFNRTNSAELVGKTAVFNKESYEAVFASYLIRTRVDDELYSPEFLSYYINSAFGRSYISSVVSQQVGQANVNGTKLANMPIPYPHISEQKKIVSEIERHFSQIDHLENTITTSLRQAESLRESILKRAFEGKLVPQDPNDEPASILLERIKAEKVRHAAEVKKGKTLQPKLPKRKIKNAN